MAAPTQFDLYQMALRLLGEARLATITDNVASRYALDDAWPRAIGFVLQQAAWRFALKTAPLTPVAGTMIGYAYQATLPSDCLQQQAYFVPMNGRECPFDLREQGGIVAFNVTQTPAVRYISSSFVDPTVAPWPEHFTQVAAAYLAFSVAEKVTGSAAMAKQMSSLFASLFPEAVKSDAIPWDFWMPYQRTGEFFRAARVVIGGGNWVFAGAMKSLTLDPTEQETAAAASGWAYRYAIPADWLRTQALYVSWGGTECPFDIRETSEEWSTNTASFTARYVSTAALDSTLWPEAVTKAVAAYLDWKAEPEQDGEKPGEQQLDGSEFQALLKEALDEYAIPENPWLRFQLDGSYMQGVLGCLERGRWRFAVKTVILTDPNNPSAISLDPLAAPPTTPVPGDPNAFSDGSVSPGYTCRMLKPDDWLRTLRVYYSYMDGLRPIWIDIDFRDELGAVHANYNPIVMRYLSRLGLDATQWPSNFRDAVLAWLQHIEARADPKMAAVAKERLDFYRMQEKEAMALDDERDMPRTDKMGRFIAGRYGRGSLYRAQDWWPI